MGCGVWCVALLLGDKGAGQRPAVRKAGAGVARISFLGGALLAGRAGTACRAPTEKRSPDRRTKCVARLVLMDDNAGWPGGSLT